MKNQFTLVMIALLICLNGCDRIKHAINNAQKYKATSITTTDSTVVVDGNLLKYGATQVLSLKNISNKIVVKESIVDIDLQGSDAQTSTLQVAYQECEPGDASLSFDGTYINLKTKSGKPAIITKISGQVPRTARFDLTTDSGNIAVSNITKSPDLKLKSASGDLMAIGINSPELSMLTASGNISVQNSVIQSLT